MLLRLFGGSDLSLGLALIYSLLGMLIVFLVLAFLIVIIMIMAKLVGKKNRETAPAAPAAPAVTEPAVKKLAKGSCGGVNLYNVDDRTAAMIMAIVADKTNKPLNELRFISIKEIEE